MLLKKSLQEQPLNYWEEQSVILGIFPKEDLSFTDGIYERVAKIKGIDIIYTKPIEITKPGVIKFTFDKETYEMEINIIKFSLPDTYINKAMKFKEEEINNIKNTDKALLTTMKYKKDSQKEYQLQLKILTKMIPNLIGIIDESAEKLLPLKWVEMTTKSNIVESPNSLYTIHAVYENNEVWLHTHGLNRCGLTELEILDSNKENYNNHYNLISSYANYLICNKETNPRNKSAYIGVLINREPILATCISWTEALKYYKKIKLGNKEDRKESHNTYSSVIFVYKNEKDEKHKKISKINIYDSLLGNNPIFFISNKETKRMRLAAQERFNFVIENYKNKKTKVLLKIGLPVEKKYGSFEHIWFELLEIENDKIKGELTQEPYNVKDIKEGYIGWYKIGDITDWIIIINDQSITPNNVYLLM